MDGLTLNGSNAQPAANTKRKQWSTEERALIVRASLKKGATVSAVAQLYGVPLWQLYEWRKRARQTAQQTQTAATLVPVHVTGSEQSDPGELKQIPSIVVEAQSMRITITGSVEGTIVRTILECLAR